MWVSLVPQKTPGSWHSTKATLDPYFLGLQHTQARCIHTAPKGS